MKAGVSTACLYPKQMEQALEEYGQLGINKVELFFNTPSELKENSLVRLKNILRSYNMEAASIHPFTSEMEPFFFFSDYTGRLKDGIDLYRRYFEAAAFLGAKVLVFHGDYRQNTYPWEKGFSHVEALWEAGQQYGVEVMQENVARCKSGSLNYLLAMQNALPQMRFVLDCKQALRAGHRAEEFMEKLGNKIGHFHISDNKQGEDCLPIGWGNTNWEEFFDNLKRQEFNGFLVLELYFHNFQQVIHLKEGFEQMNKWINITNRML